MARQHSAQTSWEAFVAGVTVDDKAVADIGCGNGWFAASFFRSARSVLLIDGDAAILNQAKERWFSLPNANPQIDFRQANFVESPLPPDSFDVIGMVKTY